MSKIPSLHPVLQGWLLNGPLAAYVPAYLERLERGRYASSTSRRCLNAVAHFAHWMSLCRLPMARIDESRVDQFLQEHLPHCGCRGPVMRHPREAHAALMPLLATPELLQVVSRRFEHFVDPYETEEDDDG